MAVPPEAADAAVPAVPPEPPDALAALLAALEGRAQAAEVARGEADAAFSTLVHNSLDLLAIVDRDLNSFWLDDVSQDLSDIPEEYRAFWQRTRVEQILGYTREEVNALPPAHMLHPDDAAQVLCAVDSLYRNPGSVISLSARIQHKDGSWVPMEIAARRLRKGAIDGILVNARDISQSTHFADQLRHLAWMVETVSEAIVSLDRDYKVYLWNNAAEQLLGVPRDQALGRPLQEILPALFALDRLEKGAEAARADRSEAWEQLIDGEPGRWVQCRLAPVRDTQGADRGLVLVARDITGDKEHEAQLLELATMDSLTGLPNRACFQARLDASLERLRADPSRGFCVLFLDLDRFKTVNDTLGHTVGDELLRVVAARLKAEVRACDMVSRFGGDEFTVLLDQVPDSAGAQAISRSLQQAIREPIVLEDGRHLFTSVTIGIATGDAGYTHAHDFLRDADGAMYQAKARGSNQVQVFSADLRPKMLYRMEMENELRRAFERRELWVAYQPIVCLETGQIVGMEALSRWRLGGRQVSPADFIPAAEDTGLIIPLGAWVLEQACVQLRNWQVELGDLAPRSMNVNVSARQFRDPSLLETVTRALTISQIEPRDLRIEITEGIFIDDESATLAVMGRLNELGVTLSMDDFGTGYSSLGYLHRFPIRGLKVDRSFVSRMDEDGGKGTTLVRAIVRLAQELGITVTAEGVETQLQAETLREMACDYGQGYVFARPGDAASVTEVLRRWSRPK